MFQKKFLSSLFWMVVLNILIKPFAIFGIDATVQNNVGTKEYGFYFTLLNFSYLFNIVLDLGVTNFNTKHVAQYPHLMQRYMGKIISLRIILLLIYFVISLGLGIMLGFSPRQFNCLYFLLLTQFFVSVLLFFRSYLAGLLLFKWDIVLSVLDRIFLIALVGGILITQTTFKIEWFIYAQTITFGMAALVAVIVVFYKVGIPKIQWHWSINQLIIIKSYPYALLILLMMMYSKMDTLMIERWHVDGLKQVGIYAQAYRLLDASFMFLMLFTNLLLPLFTKSLSNRNQLMELIGISFALLFVTTFTLSIIGYRYSSTILELLYTHDLLKTSINFKILITSLIPSSFILLLSTLLTAKGDLKVMNMISFGGLFCNLFFNILFIPNYGAQGAAMGTLISQSIIVIVYAVLTAKKFNIELNWKSMSKYLVFMLIGGSMFLLSYYFESGFKEMLVLFICLMSIGFMIQLIPLKLFIHSIVKK
jgi:O-antigen/teichoic acid export membrane protein